MEFMSLLWSFGPFLAVFIFLGFAHIRLIPVGKTVAWVILILLFWPIFLPVSLWVTRRSSNEVGTINQVALPKDSSIQWLSVASVVLPVLSFVIAVICTELVGTWDIGLWILLLSFIGFVIGLLSFVVEEEKRKAFSVPSLYFSSWALIFVALDLAGLFGLL